MIKLEQLTKRFGDVLAVDHLSFEVRPGVVTGFLGPNGSGKSTTMRMILGLDHPTSGQVTIDGRSYRHLERPLRTVGALLDAKALHPGRSAKNHLLALAASNSIPLQRVDVVLEIVGLSAVANKRVGKFSLGMGQRLGIAAALLGDPEIMLFDEPINGLDPEGIRWVRELFHSFAKEGRTVFVSSHLMAEMGQTADEIVVIGKGQMIRQGSVDELTAGAVGSVFVRSPAADTLRMAARDRQWTVVDEGVDSFVVDGVNAADIGDLAASIGVTLHELTPRRASLEDVFMELTAGEVEFSGSTTASPS